MWVTVCVTVCVYVCIRVKHIPRSLKDIGVLHTCEDLHKTLHKFYVVTTVKKGENFNRKDPKEIDER